MIGERENFDSQTQYGSLIMRQYNIDGNEISAFYDFADKLVFVLDNTINSRKPNILLVINPDADKKWDEILSGDYGIDLETIRPKQDNKYQKFDIEYSGLGIYDALIKAYDAGDSLEESLNQLMILRDSAARHSAMTRLNAANEVIAKTNTTIVKTKESIVRLQARIKTLRAKLAEAKKGIGREPTKQSASKILKLESQLDVAGEKLKRAQERLKSAQRRLETAIVDAELASELLNLPSGEIKQVVKKQAPVVVPAKRNAGVKKKQAEPQYEEDEEEYQYQQDDADNLVQEEHTEEKTEEIEEDYSEEETEKVKPLFNEDPQILDDDIAFKPISFEAPVVPEISKTNDMPNLNQDTILVEETTETTTEEDKKEEGAAGETAKEQTPVLESMIPVPVEESEVPAPIFEPGEIEETDVFEERPLDESLPVESGQYGNSYTDKTSEEEPLNLEVLREEDTRQPEPEVAEETAVITEEKPDNKYTVVPPVVPVAPVAPQRPVGVDVIEEEESRRPKFFYYLLLILLIVLAVFTLWLYQKHIKPSVPVLAASIEKTELPKEQNTVFKKGVVSSKTSKNIKAPVVKEVKKDVNVTVAPSFLDEEPVIEPMPEPVSKETYVVEANVEVVEQPTEGAPQVLDAVPARMTTSGHSEEPENKASTEEDILASKPEFQPGAKYDEMFVPDEGGEIISPMPVGEYVENDVVYAPEEENVLGHVEENEAQNTDSYFDEEEAAYQAEQAELYYEE